MDQQWRRVAQHVTERMAQIPVDQAELTRRAGVSDPTVRALMTGLPRAANPRSGPLRKVSAALGWTPDSIERILAGEDPVMAGEPPPDVLFRLGELERLTAVMATELRELADTVVDLAGMSHQHAGRRRGEGIASGQ